MSIVIYKPKDVELSGAILGKCADDGYDKIGFCYSLNGEIVLENQFKNFDNFLEKFNSVAKNLDSFIHFAESDCPIGSKKFCGPFRIDSDHVLIHSGEIWENSDDLMNKEFSQTYNLILLLRKFWSPGYFGKEYLKWMIEKFIGYKNRIVIMDKNGNVQFFNHTSFGAGWISKSWFSDIPIGKKVSFVTPTHVPPNNSQANCYIPAVRSTNLLAYSAGYLQQGAPPTKCERCNQTVIPSYIRIFKNEKLCLTCFTSAQYIPGNIPNLKVYSEQEQDLSWIEDNKYISEDDGPDAAVIDIFDLI